MGFIPAEGTFESTVANYRIKQIATRRSQRVVLLVDHSKFGKRALARVLDADEIDCVVTDDAASREHLAELADAGTEYVLAPKESGKVNVA